MLLRGRSLLKGMGLGAAPGAARGWIRPASASVGAMAARGIAASRPAWADAAGAGEAAAFKRKPRHRNPKPGPNPCPSTIIVAQIVERLPALTPLKEQWELDYEELKARKDSAVRKPLPVGWYKKIGMEHVEDFAPDKKDEEELVYAPRRTEADEANDVKSLRRALDRRVYLLLKGKDGKWTFPQTERNEGEIMRAAAKRSLEEFVGTELNILSVGFCPIAHSDEGEGDKKVRTFYYQAEYYEGQLKLQANKAVDFMWATKEEVKERMPKELYPMFDDIIDH